MEGREELQEDREGTANGEPTEVEGGGKCGWGWEKDKMKKIKVKI